MFFALGEPVLRIPTLSYFAGVPGDAYPVIRWNLTCGPAAAAFDKDGHLLLLMIQNERGLFGDVVMDIDWSVGQILDALRQHHLDRDTLVIFTSDNGPWLSYGEHAGSATLRGWRRRIWNSSGNGWASSGGRRYCCLPSGWPLPALNRRC